MRQRQAPGPDGRDMLRSVRTIRRDAPGFLLACQRRYGDVVDFPLPSPVLLVSEPAAARRVLQDNHRGYDKATVQYRSLALVTGAGLLTSDGEPWRRQRRLAQPAFHAGALAAVADRTAEAAVRVAARWSALPDGSVIDVDAAMMHATLDVVGHALFSTDLGSHDAAADELVAAVLAALDEVVARARSPLPAPRRVPTPSQGRLRRALATLDRAVQQMLAERRAVAGAGARPAGDLLDLLLEARDAQDGTGMTDRQVRDEVVTLLVAGHETVASALTWTWHLLARHPLVLQRLHAELDALADDEPAYDRLSRLPWTRAVLEEALRLYPPAWVLTRRALAPDELAGVPVAAGTLVIISPWVLHRHPDAWAEPGRFDPERFLPQRRAALVRGAYLPFGAGPRLCIGREFALVEGTLLLAALARRFQLAPAGSRPVRHDALVTVRPHGGLPMRLTRRPQS